MDTNRISSLGNRNIALEIKCHPPNSSSQEERRSERVATEISTTEVVVSGGPVHGISKEDGLRGMEVEERLVEGIGVQAGV